MEEVLHIILLLLGFVAVLAAAYLAARFMGARMTQGTGSKYLKIVDKILVGNDKSICLIQVGNHYYLVGITSHHVESLGKIDNSELIPLETGQASFEGLLNKYMMSRKNEGEGQESPIDKIKDKLERRKEFFKKF